MHLISPYGGRLVNLLPPEAERFEIAAVAARLPQLRLSRRLQLDLELLAVGAFSPLDRFMGAADYRSVCQSMRLADGTVFPLPVTLPLTTDAAVDVGMRLALCTDEGRPLAVLDVEEIYQRDWQGEARQIYGSDDRAHPVIAEMGYWGDRLVSGRLVVVSLPVHHSGELCHTPSEVRQALAACGRATVVAFNTRNPLHRVHEELMRRAVSATGGTLLVHPVVGLTRPGDVAAAVRMRIYRRIVERYYDPRSTVLAVIPLAMRMAGPREAAWHALIRRNYGASHFIVGRDHAGPGVNSRGEPFFAEHEARDLAQRLAPALGVEIIGFSEMVYIPDEAAYRMKTEIDSDTRVTTVSGSKLRAEVAGGRDLPEWLTRHETSTELTSAQAAARR